MTLRRESMRLSEDNQRLTLEKGFESKENEHRAIEMREHIKNKELQLKTLGDSFEERMRQIRRIEIENKMLNEQTFILKTALSKLEQETGGTFIDPSSFPISEQVRVGVK